MIRRLLRACVGAMLVGALVLSAHAVAKPPDLPEDGSFTATPATSPPTPTIEVLPMPHEDADVTCPYLRQQMIDRHACQIADPEIGREVLDNLERLKQADNLLELAKDLARGGFFTEAMEYCARAAELCPGSPCAERASQTMLELAFGIVTPASASEESEPPTCPYCGKTGKPIREIVPEKKKSAAYDISLTAPPPTLDYDFEVGANGDGGLRLCADCSLGGNVYHLSYKDGCLKIWKTLDAGKTKP